MDSLSDGAQAEMIRTDFMERNPETSGGIIGSLDSGMILFHMTDIEHVKGVDIHARILVYVWNGKEILHFFNAQPSLFLDLTDDTLFARFLIVNKTTRQVKGTLGRLLAAADDKQFVFIIQNEGCRGRTGVLVIGEPTVRTVFALKVVLLKIRTPALRTELEDL